MQFSIFKIDSSNNKIHTESHNEFTPIFYNKPVMFTLHIEYTYRGTQPTYIPVSTSHNIYMNVHFKHGL